jgi:SAM-dependent methyltransferase
MTDWDGYARSQPHTREAYEAEPVQVARMKIMARRAKGSVLDVGSSDGYSTSLIRDAGHPVRAVDISPVRASRVRRRHHIECDVEDATDLPYEDNSVDTVCLGEIVEHLDNPGAAMVEAFRVARERVVISVPLNGWEDPTHEWRISLDVIRDPKQRKEEPTKGEQIVLTFQRGKCWPRDYPLSDPSWHEQFEEKR